MNKILFALVTLTLISFSIQEKPVLKDWGFDCDSKPGCFFYSICKNKFTTKTLAKQVDVNKYIGRWFEQARTPQTFQNSLCAVADYEKSDKEGVINVYNHALDESGEEIRGTATVEAEGTNRFSLVFNFFAKGQYWIHDIEEDQDGNYDWALIGGPCRDFLYVLSRNPVVDRKKVDEKLKLFNEKFGFNYSEILYRGSSCKLE